jgi:hypothetical protein
VSINSLAGPPRLEAVHLDHEPEELSARQLVIEIRLIRHKAEQLASLRARCAKAADPDDARGRGQEPADHLDGGRLPRPVGAQESKKFARTDLQVKPVDRTFRSKQLGHAAHFDHEPGTLV